MTWLNVMEYLCQKWPRICSTCRKHFPVLSSRQVPLVEQELLTRPEHLSSWGSCFSIFSFMCMFCKSLFVLLYFYFLPFCCLFFDIWILITSLISSNASYFLLTSAIGAFVSRHISGSGDKTICTSCRFTCSRFRRMEYKIFHTKDVNIQSMENQTMNEYSV